MKPVKPVSGLFPPLDRIRTEKARTQENITHATTLFGLYSKATSPSAQLAAEYQSKRIALLQERLVRLQDMRSTWFWTVAVSLLGGIFFVLTGVVVTGFLLVYVWFPPYQLIKPIYMGVLSGLISIVWRVYKWACNDLVHNQVIGFLLEDCDHIQNQPTVSFGRWDRDTVI